MLNGFVAVVSGSLVSIFVVSCLESILESIFESVFSEPTLDFLTFFFFYLNNQ